MKRVLVSMLIVAAGVAADATKDRFRPQQRPYWAFQKVTRPNAPAVPHAKSVRSPIDAFVLVKLEAKGVAPGFHTDQTTLLRRVSLDLKPADPPPAAALIDISVEAPATRILAAGSSEPPAGKAPPGFLSILHPRAARISPPAGLNTTGRVGGGMKRGAVVGTADEVGLRAVERPAIAPTPSGGTVA